jgi:hypothetical protein
MADSALFEDDLALGRIAFGRTRHHLPAYRENRSNR